MCVFTTYRLLGCFFYFDLVLFMSQLGFLQPFSPFFFFVYSLFFVHLLLFHLLNLGSVAISVILIYDMNFPFLTE